MIDKIIAKLMEEREKLTNQFNDIQKDCDEINSFAQSDKFFDDPTRMANLIRRIYSHLSTIVSFNAEVEVSPSRNPVDQADAGTLDRLRKAISRLASISPQNKATAQVLQQQLLSQGTSPAELPSVQEGRELLDSLFPLLQNYYDTRMLIAYQDIADNVRRAERQEDFMNYIALLTGKIQAYVFALINYKIQTIDSKIMRLVEAMTGVETNMPVAK